MELAGFPIVYFKGDYGGVSKGDDPESLGVQGTADEEVYLVSRISLLRGQPVGQLKLVVGSGFPFMKMFLKRGFYLKTQEPLPFDGQKVIRGVCHGVLRVETISS